MRHEIIYPTLIEPPIAQALDHWDGESNTLVYEYNGRPVITVTLPKGESMGFRHRSDGNIQTMPFIQQIYLSAKNVNNGTVPVKITFHLSSDAINMRPHRAGCEQAIIGQAGRPLIYGVNGLYDLNQDLLIDWYGYEWKWSGGSLKANADGDLTAEIRLELGKKPFFINLRMQYYRKYLGYSYHKPWKRKPDPKPVAGWCSWEAFRRNVTEKDMADVADFFGKNLKAYGLEYIQLDDGYEKLPIPDSSGGIVPDSWLETNSQFPSGHKGNVENIKRHGMQPGIWTNSVVTNPDFAVEKPEVFVKDRDGNPLHGEWIEYVLDCLPETLEKHVAPYYRGLKDAGYTYFKTDAIRHLIYDGLQVAVCQGLMTNGEAEARFRSFLECARESIGDNTYFLASWGVLSEAVGIVDACRIAIDANPTWEAVCMQILESARWFFSQRVLFLNDPDHICVRGDFESVRSILSLVSLSGELFMLSDPLDAYDADRLRMISRTLPPLDTITGETGPLDMTSAAFAWTKQHGFAFANGPHTFEGTCIEDITNEEAIAVSGEFPTMHADHPFSSLWAFHIQNSFRRWCVVGRFATLELHTAEIGMEALGLDPSKQYLAFDFWAQKYLGCFSGKLPCGELKVGHCQIISLCPAADSPQFLASTRHVSMDAVSVKSQTWINNELSLELTGVVGTTETYWFHAPAGFNPTGIYSEGSSVALIWENEIIRVDISFNNASCKLKLKFN